MHPDHRTKRPSPSTPVLVGVGQAVDRLDDPGYRAASRLDLCAEAARAALADAGARSPLAPQVDAIATTRSFEGSSPRFPTPFGKSDNVPRSLARRLGMAPPLAVWEVAGGNTPQRLVREFCGRIAAGELDSVLLAGGEALSSVRHLAAEGRKPDWSESVDEPVEDRGPQVEGLVDPYAISHGLQGAPASYALLEHARRARLKQSRQEYALAMGRLFAPFSGVAAANPYSSSRVEASTAEALVTVDARNRMIADPYPRMLVARDQVNQAAALVLCSVERARALGIPEEKWVYLHGHVELRDRLILERADLGASPAAALASRAALEAAGIGVDEVGCFDLYSCFPIAVFSVCDALGLATEDPRGLTLTGGLPFFGGPGNNYSMHGIAEVVQRLRADPGSYGFVGANGGILSKYAVGIYSTRPCAFEPRDDTALQQKIDALPHPEVRRDVGGWAEVETYTVRYDRERVPVRALAVGRLESDGARFIATTRKGDSATVRSFVDQDPIGTRIFVRSVDSKNLFSRDAAGL